MEKITGFDFQHMHGLFVMNGMIPTPLPFKEIKRRFREAMKNPFAEVLTITLPSDVFCRIATMYCEYIDAMPVNEISPKDRAIRLTLARAKAGDPSKVARLQGWDI